MNKKKASKQKGNNIIRNASPDFYMIPVYFLIVFYPLITRLKMLSTGLEEFHILPSVMGMRADLFLYYKSIALLVVAMVMGLILIDRVLIQRKPFRFQKEWLFLLAFLFLSFLSSILSKYRQYSMGIGMTDSFESVWTLCAYVMVFIYTYSVVLMDSARVKKMLAACMISAGVQGTIGIWQLCDRAWMEGKILNFLVLPAQYRANTEGITFYAGEDVSRSVYGTLYNTNYAGIFFAMMIPVFVGYLWNHYGDVFTNKQKATRGKDVCAYVFAAIGSLISMVCLLGTAAKTAWIALVFVLICMTIYLGVKRQKSAVCGIVGLAALLLVSIGYIALSGNNPIKNMLSETKAATTKLQHMEVSEDGVFVSYGDRDLFAYYEENEKGLTPIVVSKETKEAWNQGDVDLQFDAYEKDGIRYLLVTYNGIHFRFTKDAGFNRYTYINMWGEPDVLMPADVAFSQMPDSLFSGRGYIWKRTIPLLKKTILLGTGADTFLLHFPQKDYVQKADLGYEFYKDIVGKPHNLYLQMIIQDGLLAFLCIVVFAGLTLKRLIGRKTGVQTMFLLVPIGVFLLSGFLNDSNLILTPFLCVLTGGLIAVNTEKT